MTRMVFLGAAAVVLLASAPTVAQETAKAPDAAVANQATAPTAPMAAEKTAAEPSATDAAAAEETATDESAAASEPAAGAPISCKRGKAVREVNVVSPGANGHLCDLHYAKPTEGMADRVLWYATSDKNFCEKRANKLMAKLMSSGWSCENADGTPVNVEASATPAAEPAAETVTAPEAAPKPFEADHPAQPQEPADAEESPDAKKPSGGKQPN